MNNTNGVRLNWKIVIPPNATAPVHLPVKTSSVVRNNGKVIVSDKNMSFIKDREKATQLQLGSGIHNLEIINAAFN